MEKLLVKVFTDEKHLYIRFKNGIVLDEYDFLAMLDDIENKDERNTILLFLDRNVPSANKTYWTLRGDVMQNIAFWEMKAEKRERKSKKQRK